MEKAPSYTSTADFVALFESLPGLYLLLSPDLKIQAATKSYLGAIHVEAKEIIGKYFLDAFPNSSHPNNAEALGKIEIALVKSLREKDTTNLGKLRLDTSAGHEAYWEATNTPVFDSEGNLTYIIHEARNITEQVMAERNAQKYQSHLELMSLTANGTLWECDITKGIISWSESYKKLFGYAAQRSSFKISDWSKVVHPDDTDLIRKTFHQLFQEQRSEFTLEYRFKRADGSYADVISRGYAIYDANSAPLRIIGSTNDISLQKHHERQLADITERFRCVATATNDVIWDWNLLDNTVWWNEGYKLLFGHTHDQNTLDVSSWTDYLHPDDFNRVKTSIYGAINGGKTLWESEYRFKCADGSYKLILDKGSVLCDDTNRPIRMIGAMIDITEKKQFEAQLQDSSDRINQILETLPLMTWTATPDGYVNYYSNRWFEFTGSNFEVMQGSGWQELIHPDDQEETFKLWKESITTGKPFVIENRWFSGADNAYRWFLGRAVPLYDQQGNITLWVGSHTEIEEQKQMMLAQKESNEKLRVLSESIPHIVWSGDATGNVDYFNEQWYAYTKMTEEETLGFGWGPALHPDDRQSTVADWLHAINTGEKYERELRLRNINTQDYRWFLARALPARNDEGQITKWFGTATDIHDTIILREQLQESEKQFRFLADSIPQMVWTATPTGYHDYFNRRWLDYTKLTLEESIGMIWNDLLHPDDRQRAWDRWQHSLRTGDYYDIEYRFRDGHSGNYRWFLGLAMPMRDEEGNIVRWFGTCTDIEDHKKAEEELMEKNLELERINQDLDSFVYTASHDLKLPIINMAGVFEELTREADFKDPEAPRMIEMFDASLKQLHNTIHDLSEVVRVQKTKDRELVNISLYDTTQDVLTSLQEMVRESNIQVHLDFEEAPLVAFTRASLKSILYNLISNAIKYRAHDRVPELRLETAIKGNFIELKVTDNGLGIDMSRHHGKLFQMFKRFHSHVKGSGLGLYIVNRLLNNHGGYIDIESTINQGTTFYLYFKQKKS